MNNNKKISKNKEILNAIITSDIHHNSPKKHYHLLMIIYSIIIFLVTSVSLAMLSVSNNFVNNHKGLISTIEVLVFIILLIDVTLRWYTSDVRVKKGKWSYLLFPISITGIILIISLLPSLYLINIWANSNIKVFDDFEKMKFLRIFRIILLANLVPGVRIFSKVLSKEKSVLYVVFSIVIITIVLFALVIFNIERDVDANGLKMSDNSFDASTVQFKTFWDALYFSTITLTTIGFGDKSPHTNIGQAVTMAMSIIGIAILATPSGVIAGGFISEVKQVKKQNKTKTGTK